TSTSVIKSSTPSTWPRAANLHLDCHPCPRTPVTHLPGLYTLREGVPACSSAPPSPPPRGGLQLESRNTSRASYVIAATSIANAAAGRLAGLSSMLEAPSWRGAWGSRGPGWNPLSEGV